MSASEITPPAEGIGPILYFRGADAAGMRLAVLVVRPGELPPGDLVTGEGPVAPQRLAAVAGQTAWRYDFHLPVDPAAHYELDGHAYQVMADARGDLRIAYVSCNGQEHGDLDRGEAERNVMWARLAEMHAERPFGLLLQGGDQIYADEVTRAHPLSEDWPELPERPPGAEDLAELRGTLREAFAHRYLTLFAQEAVARVGARVPSLSMWDDHDICDGWGSLPEEVTRSGIGQELFAAAREMFLLFQFAATESDIPALFADPTGESLTMRADLPGAAVIMPDLRSERRRDRVMGETGWTAFETTLQALPERLLFMSSVPLLGPRLSVVESLMSLTPWMEKYEDDLRDQWQSHAHRQEWIRMLRRMTALQAEGVTPTLISGEIHLATRATMESTPAPLHQLVASGITHPPPPLAYARVLGTLARFGEAPVPGHPIRIRPLPGQRWNYVNERNFLTLERSDGAWSARWHLEESGTTPPLPI